MSRRQFGTVRKLPSGRWQVRYRDATGRMRTAPETFTTKGDASRFLATTETDLLRGRWHDPELGRMTFGTWYESWRSSVVDLRESTFERDTGYASRYLLPAFENTPLGELRPVDIQAWVAELSSRGLAPATVTKAGQILGKVLRAAVLSGLIVASPVDGVKLPRIERKEMRFLTPPEVMALANTIDSEDGRRAPVSYRAAILLGAYGGLRAGELFGLRAGKVDILRRRVEVSEIVVEVGGRLVFGPPKTRAGHRSVPLPRIAADALGEHLASSASQPEDLVFPAGRGGPTRLSIWRARVFNPAVKQAGLAPLRPHDLRHTAVALWIAAGASAPEIAARAGHTSVVTVLDRYAHLLPGSEEKVNDALDALATSFVSRPEATVTSLGTDPARLEISQISFR